MHAVLVPVYLLLITPITSSWWAAGSQVVMDPHSICKKSRKIKGKMSEICRTDSPLLDEISKGVKQGHDECQYQFRYRRWNCTASKRSMKKVLLRDTRETGFVNALTAAGVAYAITRACTMNVLTDCSCNKNVKRMKKGDKRTSNAMNLPESKWQWTGCGDNINYGIKVSKDFMDSRYKKMSDMKTIVKLHNYAAGRMAIKKHMRSDCKCHGLSGSCALRTCWRKMPTFREVGNRLKEHFDGAAKVIAGNDGNSFIPDGDTIKPPNREDLVYSEESPKFCTPNSTVGSLGTQGRECNATSQGEEGCDILCCGRGHTTIKKKAYGNCNCEFIWCCEVKCQTCLLENEISTCL
ncbi:PREDICTED: protein Wnt-6 [Nicrophorus vespilloides]|uniref:Protein Wnt n=1 Tax=Nicrophorus vespilloides TaxID=110193 RepID=A0ABM1MTI1_NICVS|nr:PREDICTED: protein Wnt-6 [Nicrophorus vespilloides]